MFGAILRNAKHGIGPLTLHEDVESNSFPAWRSLNWNEYTRIGDRQRQRINAKTDYPDGGNKLKGSSRRRLLWNPSRTHLSLFPPSMTVTPSLSAI